MKKIFLVFVALVVSGMASADSMEKLTKKSQDAAQVLQTATESADSAIPKQLLDKSVCIATIPNVIRGGFIFGARYGQGLVSCRVQNGWSSPAYLTIAGGSWGLQIGVDSTDVVLVFVNPNAIQRITHSKFTLGVDASVAAGPVGRDAEVATDVLLKSEIFAYSRTRGLFAGLTLDGSALAIDTDANAQMYGSPRGADGLLRAHYSTAPKEVWPYVQALMTFAP